MTIHNKLVRDKIPEIIENIRKKPVCRILDNDEYLTQLDIKLNEECAQYQEDKSLEDADVLEVMYAICNARGYSLEELESIRAKKAKDRGFFKDKIFLEKVENY